jgi:diaminobutyrate-2-oxoglutarate transaminase
MVYRDTLDTWRPGAHAGTFRGNQMAMAAGSATLRVIQEEDLPGHAAAMGRRLGTQLRALQQRWPQVGDVRGRGLMLGVELIDPDGQPDALGHPPADPGLASRLQRQCLRRGLILELGGRHGAVARFLPPLIITAEQVDEVARIFAAALAAAASEEDA